MKHVKATKKYLILWVASFVACYCFAGNPDALFEQWRSEFRAFRESKGFLGISHTTDFEKIRNFDSYKALVKSDLPDIEDLMIAEMGAYPYTPVRLYLAFAFCERRNWDWKETATDYGPPIGKSGLPDAIRKRLHLQRAERRTGQSKPSHSSPNRAETK